MSNTQASETILATTIVNPQLAAYKGQLPPKVHSLASDIVRDKTLLTTASVSATVDTRITADEITLNKVDSSTIKFDALVDKTPTQALTTSQVVNPQLGLSEANASNSLLSVSETVVNAKVFADKVLQFGSNQYQGASPLISSTALLSVDSLVNSPFAGVNAASSSAASGLPQISAGIPFQQAQWGQQVADKVLWMSSQGLKEAEIQMDPPELGPLTVKVSVSQDQAHVSFAVQHASVREALDQSALRLREMFAEEGLDLVDVDVSGQSQSEQQSEEEGSDQQGTSVAAEDESRQMATETAIDIQSDSSSLINTYI